MFETKRDGPDFAPWNEPGTVPDKVGAFEVDLVGTPYRCFQFWNGKFWSHRKTTAEEAAKLQDFQSVWQKPRWRGLNAPELTDPNDISDLL